MDYLTDIQKSIEERLINSDNYQKLTERRKIFIRNYIADPYRNATRAAMRSGYSEASARQSGSNLIRSPGVRAVLDDYDKMLHAENTELKIKIIKELCLIAFADIKEFMSWSQHGLRLVDSEELKENLSRVIAEMSENEHQHGTNRKIKTHDKLKAIAELNRMHGFYAKEELDITSKGEKVENGTVVMLPSNGREKENEE